MDGGIASHAQILINRGLAELAGASYGDGIQGYCAADLKIAGYLQVLPYQYLAGEDGTGLHVQDRMAVADGGVAIGQLFQCAFAQTLGLHAVVNRSLPAFQVCDPDDASGQHDDGSEHQQVNVEPLPQLPEAKARSFFAGRRRGRFRRWFRRRCLRVGARGCRLITRQVCRLAFEAFQAVGLFWRLIVRGIVRIGHFCQNSYGLYSFYHTTHYVAEAGRPFHGCYNGNVMSWKQTGKYGLTLLALLILVPTAASATAPQSKSTNYQVNEVFFGAGGALNNCSTNYCSKQSLGETGVGNTKGTAYQAQAGFNTDRTPYLQFVVSGPSNSAPVLNSGSTTTATATFLVKSYLSSGYSVVTVSPPPQNNAYTMHTMNPQVSSSIGTEQFGMNLVANTGCTGIPGTLGADPAQIPSTAFGFGVAGNGITNDYKTACQFKYNQGDTVASSAKSSGETDYTISYIYNISNLTPGGTYAFNDVLVATATF